MPSPDYYGSDSFVYRADDGTMDSNAVTVTLTVDPVNDPPTISGCPDLTALAGIAIGPLPVAVGDAETPADELVLSCTSLDMALLPARSIALGGSGMARTVTLTPTIGLTGVATITLTVSDGMDTASDAFRLTVSRGAQQSYLYLPLVLRNR